MRFFDSLSKNYKNLTKKSIKFYVCGPTLYDECHIGHGRIFIVFDVLYRLFKILKFDVHYVQNITDIDDKIVKKAEQMHKSPAEIVKIYYDSFININEKLNILSPDYRPKVTDNIMNIEQYIQTLINKKCAYKSSTGIYFDTKSIEYNFFENKDGNVTRVLHEDKHRPEDFCLWKFKNTGYNSIFGIGRPGWHIECSAMSEKYLGQHFDIHGGGADLKFPHHANEIAQSVGKNGVIPSDIWMHCEMININNIKMSKSGENCLFLKHMIKNAIDADTLRYFYLSYHYRTPIDINCNNIEKSKINILNIRKYYFKHIYDKNLNCDNSVLDTLMNDLNTPDMIKLLHIKISENSPNSVKTIIKVLGFHFTKQTNLSADKINILINTRLQHRVNHNFSKADKIKKILIDNYIQLEDNYENTNWYYS